MTTLMVVIAYITGAILIGIPMGWKSFAVWKNADHNDRKFFDLFWGFVLFPYSTVDGSIGSSCDQPLGIDLYYGYNGDDGNKRAYIALTAMLWAPRVAWNAIEIVVLAVVGIAVLIYFLFADILPALPGEIFKKRPS